MQYCRFCCRRDNQHTEPLRSGDKYHIQDRVVPPRLYTVYCHDDAAILPGGFDEILIQIGIPRRDEIFKCMDKIIAFSFTDLDIQGDQEITYFRY